jgi:Raf kinase inhibitor-like YbhB/YbcL family protein
MILTRKLTTTARAGVLALASCSALAVGLYAAQAQTPPPVQNPPPAGQPPPPGQRGGGGGRGGRGGVQAMSLTTFAFPDGGMIPIRHSQVGPEASPPLAWSNVPDGVTSFVLIVHDLDATTAQQNQAQTGSVTDMLHWMVWNIPGTARGLPEGIPQGPELPDGSRQISRTGPYYRGPGAAAAGPIHHYVFDLYALDAMLEVPAVGASPDETRTAVLAGIVGHLRGKATMIGLFKRGG